MWRETDGISRQAALAGRSVMLAIWFGLWITAAQAQPAPRFPNAHEQPPTGWAGPVFELSQDYPTTLPAPEVWPWKAFNFKTQPEQYINAVLAYVLEGQDKLTWRVQDNTVRKWYHVPWLDFDDVKGREFIHGMTSERNTQKNELIDGLTKKFQNWAVGFYNPPGGYVLGQVWQDANNPDKSKALFPEGTVSAKLLFSEATDADVPFLAGTFEWEGNVHKTLNGTSRDHKMMHLLQIDVAVRDSDNDERTGWVFGTFVYNNANTGSTPWEKMRPVGLMWGNDPGVSEDMVNSGTPLVETWLNPNVTLRHYGWGNRLNGPVDNKISSCLSCHSTAQDPTSSNMFFKDVPATDTATKLRWFRNIKAGEPFDAGNQSLDYSLQLTQGIGSWLDSQHPQHAVLAEAQDVAVPEADQPRIINGKKYYPVTRGD